MIFFFKKPLRRAQQDNHHFSQSRPKHHFVLHHFQLSFGVTNIPVIMRTNASRRNPFMTTLLSPRCPSTPPTPNQLGHSKSDRNEVRGKD